MIHWTFWVAEIIGCTMGILLLSGVYNFDSKNKRGNLVYPRNRKQEKFLGIMALAYAGVIALVQVLILLGAFET